MIAWQASTHLQGPKKKRPKAEQNLNLYAAKNILFSFLSTHIWRKSLELRNRAFYNIELAIYGTSNLGKRLFFFF
jgi:hypothetical protein